MILPIVAYGHPALRKVSKEINQLYPNLDRLIDNMKKTMYAASGVGLAAPQIGLPIRLFVIDASPFADDGSLSRNEQNQLKEFKRVFINAKILSETGKEWSFSEGCLSIPGISEKVFRKERITIEYLDENFEKTRETLDGMAARVVQHEYDHIEGVLFTDKIHTLTKRLIANKLKDISNGKVESKYRMLFT